MTKFLFSVLILVWQVNSIVAQNTCATAIALTQAGLPYNSGALTTCGTVDNYGVGSGACNTLYGAGEDYVYSLNITSAPVTFAFTMGGAGLWKICQVYTGCPSPAANPTNCLANFTGNPSGAANITFPSTGTYYIVIDTWPTPTCGAFTLGINPPPTCPGGLGLTSNILGLPYSGGAGTTCGQVDNITSGNVGVTCGSTSYFTGEDKVWTFTPTVSGNVNINLVSGGTYTGLMLFEGCPFSATATCAGVNQSSTGNKAMTACVVAGQPYYLVLDSYATPTCNPYTSLTISAPGSATTTPDFCGTPMPITPTGTYAGNTGTFTADSPGNLASVFCGSIENNQWFSFVASAATATFGFSNISGTNCPAGIQGQVFNTSLTSTPCVSCTNFTSMSTPCYNPATLVSGTLSATGLTVGQTYFLMIDGNGGSQCNYNIDGWSVNVLPVDVLSFTGKNMSKSSNKLEWIVAQETDLDHYLVQRSFDGATFTDLDVLMATSNVKLQKTYSYYDKSFEETINYYRLKIVDKDGSFKYSSMIAINTDPESKFLVNKIFPNPASKQLFASIDVPTDADVEYEIMDITGRPIYEAKQRYTIGTNLINVNIENLKAGIFYIKFKCNNESKTEKIIIQ
jgi:hypothetical protein